MSGTMAQNSAMGEDERERMVLPGLPDGIQAVTGTFTTHHPGRPHAIVLYGGEPWLVWQHPDGQWVTEAKVEIAAAPEMLEATREKCPICGHDWRRHDPADGRCDCASEDARDGAVCPCGRDLTWMQVRIAGLSHRALAATDSEGGDGE